MRNFKFLDNLNEYSELNNFCNKAERLAISYPNISVAYSRKALEYMVKTIYSINYKDYPEKLSLYALMTDKRFVSIIENETVLASLHFIRNVGNSSIRGIKVKSSEAILALESLQYFIGEIFKKLEIIESYKQFDKNLLVKANNNVEKVEDIAGIDILVDKNNIKGKKIDKGSKIFDGINISEKETRKLYIDLDLKEAGWEVLEKDGVVIAGNACVEILVNNIPKSKQNPNGKGYCDYVLFGDDGLPLAVVEAKRTSESEEKGAEQARQYADSLEKQYGIRPIIYYTNGYITKIIDA